MEKKEIDFLLEAATWQDSLLQSYRSLHITIQSILLATSAGLFVAVVSIQSVFGSVFACITLLIMFIFHKATTSKFKAIIIARGEDVNFWHKEILEAEKLCDPTQRYFTKFKVFQKLQRNDASYLQDRFLSSSQNATSEDIEKLIEKGLGHTRHAIDEQLFKWMSLIWWCVLISSVLFVIFRIITT